MRSRISWLALIAAGLTLGAGCAKMETHVYVLPQADTEMAFTFRLPAPLAAMLAGAMGGQKPAEGPLPPGVAFTERDEGLEHVWELRLSGPMNPSQAVCQLSKADRLLSTTYDLVIDPRIADPFGSFGEAQGNSPASMAFTALGIEGPAETEAKPPGDLKEALEGLEGQFGGMLPAMGDLDVGQLMAQVQPALYAHMPGRLTETNGEQADDSTARWVFTPETLMEGPRRFTAVSELPEVSMIEDIVARLNAHHGTDVTPDTMANIVQRGLVPNPVVEDREKATVDLHLYGELVIVATRLEGVVGPEKAEARPSCERWNSCSRSPVWPGPRERRSGFRSCRSVRTLPI